MVSPEFVNIDEPLTHIQGSTVRHYVTDALGSVMALTDDSGAVKTTYVYDPFGNVTITGETSDNPFQFAGRENDGTGLQLDRYRYYSYEMLKYISEDPIRLGGGDVNFYVRTGSNPVNRTDPFGLWSISVEAYEGLGGGFVFGRNPNGGTFFTVRVGYGVGGGVSYDPKGMSPGWDPCKEHGLLNVGLGAYGGANVGLGPFYSGYNIGSGINTENPGGYRPYFSHGPSYGLDAGWRLRFGVAGGGELTLY